MHPPAGQNIPFVKKYNIGFSIEEQKKIIKIGYARVSSVDDRKKLGLEV